MREREIYCATCQAEALFEVPPCQDDHEDCPELLCSGCGAAILIAPLTVRVWWRPRGTWQAPHQRRAA